MRIPLLLAFPKPLLPRILQKISTSFPIVMQFHSPSHTLKAPEYFKVLNIRLTVTGSSTHSYRQQNVKITDNDYAPARAACTQS